MASLKEIASAVRDTAQDGMGRIVLWKKGRSWEALVIWPEDFNHYEGTLTLDRDDATEVRRILGEDPNAILVNSYYDNLGMFEDEYLTIDVLARKLRWQYEECEAFLSEWTISEEPEESSRQSETEAQAVETESALAFNAEDEASAPELTAIRERSPAKHLANIGGKKDYGYWGKKPPGPGG